MTRERQIEILMKDGCSKSEAEKFINDGTIIYDNFENDFEFHMQEWECDEKEVAEYKKMVNDKKPVEDWGIVEDAGNTYYIRYVL